MSDVRKITPEPSIDNYKNALNNATFKLFNDLKNFIQFFSRNFSNLNLKLVKEKFILNIAIETCDPIFLSNLENLLRIPIAQQTELHIDDVGHLIEHLDQLKMDYHKTNPYPIKIVALIEAFHEICSSRYGSNTTLINIVFYPEIKLTISDKKLNGHFLEIAKEIIDKKDNNNYFFTVDKLRLLKKKLNQSFKCFFSWKDFLIKQKQEFLKRRLTNTHLQHSPPKDKDKNTECIEVDILIHAIRELLFLLSNRSWTAQLTAYARHYIDTTPTAGKLAYELNQILNNKPFDLIKLVKVLNERKDHIKNDNGRANEQQIIEYILKLERDLQKYKNISDKNTLDDEFVFVSDQVTAAVARKQNF